MKVIYFLLGVCLTFSFVVAEEDGFVPLVKSGAGVVWNENGKPIDGWVKKGGDAVFSIDKDTLVGKFGEGVDTYLCTEKKYSNFILKFDVKYDTDCNSGVQFRSGFIQRNEKELISGYQLEIVPEKDTANIYDENRRGRYLVKQTPELQAKIDKTFKKGDWNEIEIQCVGISIKTWLNGEKITDILDMASDDGIFGLQMREGDQGQIRWRNIRIKELPATPWIPLYADKKIGDAAAKPVGKWEIQDDGSLKGTTESGQPKDGLFLSNNSYKNFAVKVSFKLIAGNSGLYFRATEINKPHWLKGFQCEIATGGGDNAGLWEVDGRGWVAKNSELAQKVFKNKTWNHIGTIAIGDHLTTFLNGWVIVDIDDPKCAKEGKTGLQLHGGGNQGCFFRDYYIMPLDDKTVELIRQR
ncbi:MAG: DUF1080 domain-containing protein [Planctomycetaceae bacterium]|nr:DUF1080 domain-containing protein [Planctomycetaceae bacterium]